MIPEGCLLVCSQCRQDVFRSDKGTLRCGRCDRDFGTEVRGPLVELREVGEKIAAIDPVVYNRDWYEAAAPPSAGAQGETK